MHDRDRCEALYLRHADRVHAYARRRSDHHTADEVVAEVFLVAWRRLDAVPAEPLPWLLGVARRTLANQRRSASRASALALRLQGALPSATPGPDVDHPVLTALGTLSPRDREILLLVAWEGLAPEEIATVLEINRGAVATRLHRARKRLAAALDGPDEPILEREVSPWPTS